MLASIKASFSAPWTVALFFGETLAAKAARRLPELLLPMVPTKVGNPNACAPDDGDVILAPVIVKQKRS